MSESAAPTFQELIALYADRIELNQPGFLQDLVSQHLAHIAHPLLQSNFPQVG